MKERHLYADPMWICVHVRTIANVYSIVYEIVVTQQGGFRLASGARGELYVTSGIRIDKRLTGCDFERLFSGGQM